MEGEQLPWENTQGGVARGDLGVGASPGGLGSQSSFERTVMMEHLQVYGDGEALRGR